MRDGCSKVGVVGHLEDVAVGEEEGARAVALAVHPCALVDRAVRVYHLALPVSLAGKPLALVFTAVFVCKDALALPFPIAKAASVLQPKLSLLKHPVRSKPVLTIVLKFTLVFIAILVQEGSLA